MGVRAQADPRRGTSGGRPQTRQAARDDDNEFDYGDDLGEQHQPGRGPAPTAKPPSNQARVCGVNMPCGLWRKAPDRKALTINPLTRDGVLSVYFMSVTIAGRAASKPAL
jgi:hypothetical protein